MNKEQKAATIKDFARSETDVGSVEVQVALMTGRVNELTGHMKVHPKDHSARRGMMALVTQRRKLLDYLSTEDHKRYLELVHRLNLRH